MRGIIQFSLVLSCSLKDLNALQVNILLFRRQKNKNHIQMLSSSTIFRGQHECTSIWSRGSFGGCILQNEAWHLQVAVANRQDSLLRGHQWGSGRQWLPKDQHKVVKRKFEDQEDTTGLYIVCTCLYDSKRVYTCIYMYIHNWTMYINVHTSECTYHAHTMFKRVYTFAEIYKHVHACLYIHVYTFWEMYIQCMSADVL